MKASLDNIVLMVIALATCINAIINLRAKATVSEVKTSVCQVKEVADKTHTIVNSQKTAMMEELKASRLLTLGMANALLRISPKDEDLKKDVARAQALYEKSVIDAGAKEREV